MSSNKEEKIFDFNKRDKEEGKYGVELRRDKISRLQYTHSIPHNLRQKMN